MTASSSILPYFRRLVEPTTVELDSDAELLERFVRQREEAAFAALVARHGPMVSRLCHRVLGDAHAAEDACQATFLVLARKAASIRHAETLAAWLHGVAYRIALKARAARVRRNQIETDHLHTRPASTAPDPLAEVSGRELLAILDAELQRLPEHYRLPLILCCLEGRTQPEAARLLGWTPGSVKGRLERGRSKLQRRLLRRGLTLPAALLALEVERGAASARLPAELAASVLRAAGAAAGAGAMKAKIALVLVLMLGTVSGGIAWFGRCREPSGTAGPARLAGPTSSANAKKTPPVRTDRYGDPLPPAAVARLGSLRLYHGHPVYRVLLSPDGKRAISSSNDGNRLWDAASGREMPLRAEWRQAAIFATRDKLIAVEKTRDFDLQCWDMTTGKKIGGLLLGAKIGQLPVAIHSGYPDGFSFVALSPDGRTLAVVSGSSLRFCEVARGRVEKPIALNQANVSRTRMVFTADGKTLILQCDDASIHVWDVARRAEKLASAAGADGYKGQFAVSPDGTILATAPFTGKRVRLWDLRTLKELPPLLKQPEGEYDFIRSVAFSPDGKHLLSLNANSPNLRLWDLATRKEVRQFRGKNSQIYHTAFTADGKYLAAADGDGVTFWDTATGKFRHDFGHLYTVDSVCFAPDGRSLVSGAAYTDDIVRVWNPLTGEETARLRGHVWGIEVVAYSPDGKLIASGGQDGTVRLWDAGTGREVRRMDAKDGMIYAMAFATDGKTLASGGKRKAVHLWDVETGRELRSFDNPSKFVLRIAFSPDGKWLATRGIDEKFIQIWDATKGQPIRKLASSSAGVPSLEFSPDGQTLASGSDDASVRLWDVRSGEERRRLTEPRGAGRVFSLTFAPDGRSLAAGYGEGDGCVRVWELASGRVRVRYEGHRDKPNRWGVSSLAFSPDGTLLASGGTDRVIMVWDVTGQRTTHPPRKVRLDPKERDALWNALADADAAKASRAMQMLLAARESAAALFAERLRPAAAIDDAQIERWIGDLDSEEFAVRQKAARELRKLGDATEPALRKALVGKPSVEQRRRVKELIQQIERTHPPEYLRPLRSVEVLEYLDTPAARKALRTLANGAAEAKLTREAKASLARLEKRSADKP